MTDTKIPNELPERRSNRPIKLSHRVEYCLAIGLLCIFRIIGIEPASTIAGQFTRFVGPKIKSVSRRAEKNLKIALPTLSDKEIQNIIKGTWENLGRTTAEFAHLNKFNPTIANSRLAIENLDIFKTAIDSGKPIIFVSGHFANWETLAIALHHLGGKSGIVYRPANNPLVDELIIKLRGRVLNSKQIPKGKKGARALIDILSTGQSLAMLVDQKLNDGIEAPFFGKGAMTAPTPARLALKYNALILPVSIKRLPGTRFRLTVQEPIIPARSNNLDKDIYDLTRQINKFIEEAIIDQPDQWLWFHRRWPKDNYR